MTTKFVPFVFTNRDCPACGGIKTIKFIDNIGRYNNKISETKDGVYEVKCQKCNKQYIIEWNKNIPQLVDKDASIKEFEKEFIDNKKRNIDELLFSDYID